MDTFAVGLKRYAKEEAELKKARRIRLDAYRQGSRAATETGTRLKEQHGQRQSLLPNQAIDKSVKTKSTLLSESQRSGSIARPRFNPSTPQLVSSSSTVNGWTPLPRDPLQSAPRRKSAHCLQQAMRQQQQQIRRQQQQQQQQQRISGNGDGPRNAPAPVAKVGGARSPSVQYDASTTLISAQPSARRGAGLTRNPIAGTTRVSSRAAMLAARGATTAAAAGVTVSRNRKRVRLLRVAPSGNAIGSVASSIPEAHRQGKTPKMSGATALVPAAALVRHGKNVVEKPRLFFCRFCSSQQTVTKQKHRSVSEGDGPRLQVVQLPVACMTPTEVTVASSSVTATNLQ